MMRKTLILMSSFLVLLIACEEPYIPPSVDRDQEVVVEGYIEAGNETLPTFVTLTQTLPYTGVVDSTVLSNLFIRDADVRVFDGTNTVALTLVCLSDLPAELREELIGAFQLLEGTPDFCVYVDLADEIDRRIGGTYDLMIDWDGREITATTTIPPHVPLDTIYFKEPAGNAPDSLLDLWTRVADPAGQADYYRYFTGVWPRPITSGVASVTDDDFFDGDDFEFTLARHAYLDEEVDTRTFGLYTKGDSIVVKWCNIDRAHYDFWTTLEYNGQSGGPFSSFTRVDHNVNGALGVWGGYSVSVYRVRVPEN